MPVMNAEISFSTGVDVVDLLAAALYLVKSTLLDDGSTSTFFDGFETVGVPLH
jgi:hypothetical protein